MAGLSSWLRDAGVWAIAQGADLWRAEQANRFLWLPVLLAVGIGYYFSLPAEPGLGTISVAWSLAAGTGIAAKVIWRRTSGATPILRPLAAFLLIVLAGFTVAKLRTHLVAAPVLMAETGFVDIEGRLLSVEEGPGSRRMVIAPTVVGELAPEALPAKVRLVWRGQGFDTAPGDVIALRGNLSPPPAPVAPGAYDFARQLYFDRIGGVGFAVSAPRVLDAGERGLGHRIEALRLAIGRRITEAVGDARPEVAAVCVALVTGKRDAVPPETEAALRDAGLAHLLAISGLHMGLVAGLLFFGLRLLLVQSEYLALHYPIKKWAAAAALIGASGYLLISGAAWSTQRAFIMAAIFFVAILLDRRALSLRNVAIAATVILSLRPEALFQAGFQMSFAAVTVLIAAYEWWQQRQLAKPADDLDALKGPGLFGVGRIGGAVWRYMAGLGMTSILAGWATGPFAIFHFNRIATYGLAGNLLAMPVMGFVIMPMAIAGLILMPLGLDGWAWKGMGLGVGWVIDIATMVSGWSGALIRVPQTGLMGFLLVVCGGLVLCLMRTKLRLAGAVLVLAGMVSGGQGVRPDMIVSPEAANIAMRLDDELVLLNRRRERFAAGVWLAKAGQDDLLRATATVEDVAETGEGPAACDEAGCVVTLRGRRIAVSETQLTLAEDCRQADLVIARYAVPAAWRDRCAAQVIDTAQLARDGTTAVNIRRNGAIRLQTNREARGTRPWTAGGLG